MSHSEDLDSYRRREAALRSRRRKTMSRRKRVVGWCRRVFHSLFR